MAVKVDTFVGVRADMNSSRLWRKGLKSNTAQRHGQNTGQLRCPRWLRMDKIDFHKQFGEQHGFSSGSHSSAPRQRQGMLTSSGRGLQRLQQRPQQAKRIVCLGEQKKIDAKRGKKGKGRGRAKGRGRGKGKARARKKSTGKRRAKSTAAKKKKSAPPPVPLSRNVEQLNSFRSGRFGGNTRTRIRGFTRGPTQSTAAEFNGVYQSEVVDLSRSAPVDTGYENNGGGYEGIGRTVF